MHWDYLQRQVRITGPVHALAGRGERRLFRIASLAEPHRRLGKRAEPPIGSRAALIAAVNAAAAQRFGTPDP
jgi:pyridoxine/pyridoxamine 5'-phosphate oxidase